MLTFEPFEQYARPLRTAFTASAGMAFARPPAATALRLNEMPA